MMKEIKLSEIAKFINGFAFKPTDWSDEGLKIIRIQNLTDKSKPYNRTSKNVPSKYIVSKGDILISWSATIDIFEWHEEDALLNQHIFKIEFDAKKVNKTYFKQALKKSIYELSRFAHGSTMKHLLKKDFENHCIPLPPTLDDQKRIAKTLSNCEELIQKRKESIDLLDELLKSTFLEMFGNEKKFESKSVEAIASDEKYALSSGPFGSNLTSKDYTEDGVIILRGTNISSGELDLTKIKYVSEKKAQELKRSELKPDDVVIVAVGSSGTALKIPKSLPRAIMSQNFNKITPNKEKVLPIYLEYSVNSEIVQRQFRKVTTNAGRSFLGLTKIKEVKIPVPPIDEQLKFYEIIDKVSAIKQQFNSSLKELENLYGSLSKRAFKGELDLSKVDISDMEDSAQEKPEMEPVGDPRWEGKVEVQDYQVHLDEIIKKDFENSSFSFKQLEDAISERGVYVPYDNVKDFVFKSLEGNESLLVQEMDEKDKQIVFKIRS